jgi:hypothetical protein
MWLFQGVLNAGECWVSYSGAMPDIREQQSTPVALTGWPSLTQVCRAVFMMLHQIRDVLVMIKLIVDWLG